VHRGLNDRWTAAAQRSLSPARRHLVAFHPAQ
jgi:hypothetical protein